MNRYIYARPEWPRFHWSREALAEHLPAVRHEQGRLLGRMEALDFAFRQKALLETLTEDVLNSSDIEGERLDAEAGSLLDSAAPQCGYRWPQNCGPGR